MIMQDDPQRIQEKIKELNEKYPPAQWQEVPGYSSLADAVWTADDKVDTNLNSTYTIKLFVNASTGEIKSFPGVLFRKKAE
jgi:hypothetical protein